MQDMINSRDDSLRKIFSSPTLMNAAWFMDGSGMTKQTTSSTIAGRVLWAVTRQYQYCEEAAVALLKHASDINELWTKHGKRVDDIRSILVDQLYMDEYERFQLLESMACEAIYIHGRVCGEIITEYSKQHLQSEAQAQAEMDHLFQQHKEWWLSFKKIRDEVFIHCYSAEHERMTAYKHTVELPYWHLQDPVKHTENFKKSYCQVYERKSFKNGERLEDIRVGS